MTDENSLKKIHKALKSGEPIDAVYPHEVEEVIRLARLGLTMEIAMENARIILYPEIKK